MASNLVSRDGIFGSEGGSLVTRIDELRDMIASIDKDIVELIATRMEIADELGRAKKQAHNGYRNPEIESQVINRYLELSQEVDISEEDARKIAETILEISLARQKKITE